MKKLLLFFSIIVVVATLYSANLPAGVISVCWIDDGNSRASNITLPNMPACSGSSSGHQGGNRSSSGGGGGGSFGWESFGRNLAMNLWPKPVYSGVTFAGLEISVDAILGSLGDLVSTMNGDGSRKKREKREYRKAAEKIRVLAGDGLKNSNAMVDYNDSRLIEERNDDGAAQNHESMILNLTDIQIPASGSGDSSEFPNKSRVETSKKISELFKYELDNDPDNPNFEKRSRYLDYANEAIAQAEAHYRAGRVGEGNEALEDASLIMNSLADIGERDHIKDTSLEYKYRDYELLTPMYSEKFYDLQHTRAESELINDLNERSQGQHYTQKKSIIDIANVGIGMADQSYASGDNAEGDAFMSNARAALDILTDFTPGVSLAKDSVSLMTGVNPVTGEVLSDLELGVLAATIFLPATMAGSAKAIGKAAVKLSRKSGKIGDLGKKVVDRIKGSDDILTPYVDCLTYHRRKSWIEIALSFIEDTAYACAGRTLGTATDKALDSAKDLKNKLGTDINIANFAKVQRTPVSESTVILDNNVASAWTRAKNGGNITQAGDRNSIAKIGELGADDLRITDISAAKELDDLSILNKGFEITTKRTSSEYGKVLSRLEEINLGGSKGHADRILTADLFFAKGGSPRFMTADKNVFNKLFTLSGGNIQQLGKSVPEAFPNGFPVTLNGKTINVIPISGK